MQLLGMFGADDEKNTSIIMHQNLPKLLIKSDEFKKLKDDFNKNVLSHDKYNQSGKM